MTEIERLAGIGQLTGFARLHEQYAAAWVWSYPNPRTRASYLLAVRQFFAWCDRVGFDPLRAERAHLDLFVRDLELQGLSDRTRAGRISAICSFYRYLCDEDVIGRDPTRKIARPKIPKKSPTGFLRRQQMFDVLDGARALGPHPYALLLLLSANGLRISEACGIDVTDLCWRDRCPQLQILRKGGGRQRIALGRVSEHAVFEAIGDRTDGPLLLNRKGSRMDQKAAQRIIDKAVLNIRGEHCRVTPHVFRHSWTLLALDTGASPEQVRHDGGWTGLAMVSYYADHDRDAPMRSSTHAVEAALFCS